MPFVHTYPIINTVSENALQSGIFWKRRFRFTVWTFEDRNVSRSMTYQYWIQPTHVKEMAGYGDFRFMLCIKRLWNIFGYQKHVQTKLSGYCINYYFLLEINTVQQTDRKCQSTLFDRTPNQHFPTSLWLCNRWWLLAGAQLDFDTFKQRA